MIFALFQRRDAVTVPPTAAANANRLHQPQGAASLLATPRRKKLLEHIWQRTSLSRPQFARLYRAPIERYAELVQQFPASEAHHHAYLGGMLDHGLEIVAYALQLRQSHLLPVGAAPEVQAAQSEAWTAATAYAALLHDLGKIAVDLEVEFAGGTPWHPWHGPLDSPYRFRYRKGREYRLHGAATGLLYNRLLDQHALDWLSGYPELWASLLYVLAGQYEHAGVLGELVTKADQASVAQELGGDPAKAMAAPKHALQRKLLDGLRYLLREELKLNQPQASDGWLTQDALWLVSKTVSDKLRAHLLSQGFDGIPASNLAVFTVLQEHGIALPTPDDKAIWKATVTSDTGWSHSFTFLKIAPALIWEPNERPATFAGNVVVDTDSSQAGATADAVKPETPPEAATGAATAEISGAISQHTTLPTIVASRSVGQQVQDDVDELINLLNLSASNEVETPAKTPATSSPVATAALVPAVATALTPAALSSPDSAPALSPHQTSSSPATSSPASSSIASPTLSAEPSGEHFVAWLRDRIVAKKLILNEAEAKVHTVAGTVYLVSPGIFQRYAQEHPQVEALARKDKLEPWRWAQRRFQRLKVHRKTPDELNVWKCEVKGPRKTAHLNGYLLTDPALLFTDVPPDNPYLRLL
jgi:integrating conjugative element relaxase (TIGR03760 family)